MNRQDRKVPLLEVDPALGAELDPKSRDLAARSIAVEVWALQPGVWEPSRDAPAPGHLGYLIVSGLMARELRVAGARGIELLGAGDLLRPWQEDAASFVKARWRALERIELAVLDDRVAARLTPFPALLDALIARAMNRSRFLAAHAAIESMRSLEDRLLVLFWQMAERWGSVTAEGVHVPLELTHQILADAVGARRPSVSSTLGKLERDGRLRRDPDGWLLFGEAPEPHQPPSSTTREARPR